MGKIYILSALLLIACVSLVQCQSLDMCTVVPAIFCCSSPVMSKCAICAGACGSNQDQQQNGGDGDEDPAQKADSKYFLSQESNGDNNDGDNNDANKEASGEVKKSAEKKKEPKKEKKEEKPKKKENKGEGTDEQIEDCCKKEKKIASKCHRYCNFKSFNKNDLKDMYLKETCPRNDMLDWMYCVSDERDHRKCCKSGGVPDLCIDFCNPAGGLPKLSSKYLPCLEEFPKMRKCFKKGYNTAPKS